MTGKVILGLLAIVSFMCLAHMWSRKDATLGKKLLWTVLVVLPLLGPMLYGSLFSPLTPEERQRSCGCGAASCSRDEQAE